jgi:hypothetical protein
MTDSEMLALIRALLPDNYSASKDWRTGNVTERIICLKAWLESKTEEVDRLIDILNDNRIKAQAAEIERLRGERERLALAICGGEDAPGYANAQTVETLEKVARDNANATMEQINRTLAVKAKLAKAVELLGQWRLASAGHVSVRSVIDKHDATLAELIGSAAVKDSLTTEDEKQSHEWKERMTYLTGAKP